MTRIATSLDIETTGLDQSKGHRIIEIAALLYDLDSGTTLCSWVRRINPQRPMDPDAQRRHKISFEEVSAEPVFEAGAAQTLVKILQSTSVVVAHNGQWFDMPFINAELARVGLPIYSGPIMDTMLQGRWATFNGKMPNLGELCFATGIPYDPDQAHAAEYDARVTMEAFFVGYRKGFFQIPPLTLAIAS